jgi:hypothetical protein
MWVRARAPRASALREARPTGSRGRAPGLIVVAKRRGAQSRHQRVVVAARRLEEPAAQRLEHGRQGVERLLHKREAAERAVETHRLAGWLGGLDEDPDEIERLARGLDEGIPDEAEVVGKLERLDGFERRGDSVGAGRQLLGEPRRDRRVEMALHPAHPLERGQERRQEPAERVEQLARSIHERPLTLPSPPPGARGSKWFPLPRRGRGSG